MNDCAVQILRFSFFERKMILFRCSTMRYCSDSTKLFTLNKCFKYWRRYGTTTIANWFSRAQEVIPGGVNSPVRAFNAVEGTPPFIVSAEGAYMTDEDGNQYIDLIGSWGPMIVGHAHPKVVSAIHQNSDNRNIIWCTNEGRSVVC